MTAQILKKCRQLDEKVERIWPVEKVAHVPTCSAALSCLPLSTIKSDLTGLVLGPRYERALVLWLYAKVEKVMNKSSILQCCFYEDLTEGLLPEEYKVSPQKDKKG